MIVLIVIASIFTWYATKVYYTRSLHINLDDLEKHGLVQAQCSSCSQKIVTHEDNLRSPFYCVACK